MTQVSTWHRPIDAYMARVAFRVDGPCAAGLVRGAVLHRSAVGWRVVRTGTFAVRDILYRTEPMEPPR